MRNYPFICVWTNWSLGPVIGLTITTTSKWGNFIVAFMAVFVAFVASRFWKILCIVIHRAFSTTEPRDTLHHQRQVILRNASSPGSGLSGFLSLLLAWRGTSVRRHLRLWPLIILASACLLVFMLSGSIFSSISTISGNDVLRNCFGNGRSTWALENTYGHMSDHPLELLDHSSAYATSCYNITDNPYYEPCTHFAVRLLPTNESDIHAKCPFQDEICANTNSNLRLDTGYIDSNDHIGLNAPASERFAWRYVLHCAPLKTKGYTSQWPRGDHSVADDVDTQYSFLSAEGPAPELERVDGDVIVAFLSGNGVLFHQALDDDWYRATVPSFTLNHKRGAKTGLKYRPLDAASPMGCVQQMQWCNSAYPRDRGCGPLASTYDAFLGAAPLFNLTSDEVHGVNSSRPFSYKAAGARLIWPALVLLGSPAASFDRVIANLGSRALTSQIQLDNGIQWPIPIHQWQDDVRHWWETVLASVQAKFIHITMVSFPQDPLTEDEVKMCQSQKYRSAGHTSFSVFGLSFVVLFGAVTIGTSFLLEHLLSCLSRRHKDRQYADLEWVTNGAIQLHRLAHEERGQSSWLRCDREVPINNAEALLPILDISDPHHPTLT
ncbi:hypothetical protein F5X98DRAFT_384082 [Xylaria grammica]|nr:hypothetical protein F5X98DRAFT_384082 [Xylaria grammica]